MFGLKLHETSSTKYIFGDGSWLLIRPSGTEPVLRLYSEAGDRAAVDELLSAGREIAEV